MRVGITGARSRIVILILLYIILSIEAPRWDKRRPTGPGRARAAELGARSRPAEPRN